MSRWYHDDFPWPQPIPIRHKRRRRRSRDWSAIIAWAVIAVTMVYLAWHVAAAIVEGRFAL